MWWQKLPRWLRPETEEEQKERVYQEAMGLLGKHCLDLKAAQEKRLQEIEAMKAEVAKQEKADGQSAPSA